MTKFLKFPSKQKPFDAAIGDITETDLYEYAFPSEDITFEVVKIEDTECVVNEADEKCINGLEPNTSNETETSTRKSQRTPKKKVIVEYGYIAKRRKAHAKKGLAKNHTPKMNRISRRPIKPTRVTQHRSIEMTVLNIKQEKTSSQTNQNIENHSTVTQNGLRKSTFIAPKSVQRMEKRPGHQFRFDGIEHYPDADESYVTGTRCKREGCKLKSKFFCLKCQVHLCIKRNTNCFQIFHTFSTGHKI
ncbi:uncharacterized protein LOC129565192 [Sitodiplosis mosellana]|uniref:uncharacterized protein LOC129565192 n=1 Tax=Sitodiplosis mosellana TaxID=263140 RepID=UPI0024439638|nr:uncharacterized protein LOC129565192 [Sitodiplosis mosellana]